MTLLMSSPRLKVKCDDICQTLRLDIYPENPKTPHRLCHKQGIVTALVFAILKVLVFQHLAACRLGSGGVPAAR